MIDRAEATLAALAAAQLPEVRWVHGDDLCDCTFQRIGEWTNPYLARTLRIRLCCVWKVLAEQYPEHVQEIPGFYDENRDEFVTVPMEWNAEDADMPRALWYRQIQAQTGVSLDYIRREYDGQEPPTRVPLGTGIRLMEGSE